MENIGLALMERANHAKDGKIGASSLNISYSMQEVKLTEGSSSNQEVKRLLTNQASTINANALTSGTTPIPVTVADPDLLIEKSKK